jgi:hypothetical protein
MKAQIDSETKLQIAGMNAQAAEKTAVNIDTGALTEQVKSHSEKSDASMMQAMQNFGQIAQALVHTIEQMNKPKKRMLQRGPDGKAVGMIEVSE